MRIALLRDGCFDRGAVRAYDFGNILESSLEAVILKATFRRAI